MSAVTHNPYVLLVDLSERELLARTTLRERLRRLIVVEETRERSGGLTDAQKKEIEELQLKLSTEWAIDPFFVAVREALVDKAEPNYYRRRLPEDKTPEYVHIHGALGSQRDVGGGDFLSSEEQRIAAVCGLMQADNQVLPDTRNFIAKVVEAAGEYRQNVALFRQVFAHLSRKYQVSLGSQIDRKVVDKEILADVIQVESLPLILRRPLPLDQEAAAQAAAEEAQPPQRHFVRLRSDVVYALSTRAVASVVRRLVADGITAADPWLAARIDSAFDAQTGVATGAPPSSLEIDLPDLEEPIDAEIIEANLQAVQAIYFSYMLEELHLFQVVEQIVELFRSGMLPLGRGSAGDRLYKYFKSANERLTEVERRDLYMRAFGAPGGDPNASLPNREFNELWLRFLSAVSSFARQLTVEKLLRNAVPMAVSQEAVRKSGRDLAANLSLHGYGIAYFAATELQESITFFRDLLQEPEIRGAFGARDMWQVIDQVNANYLGGPRNSQQYRTQAHAGAVIIRWLGKNGTRLSSGYYGSDVISPDALTNPQMRNLGGSNPLTNPTDWDLVQSCERWLAVTGVQDQSVEQYSQPIESPVITSKPIDMARDALASMGVNLPGM